MPDSETMSDERLLQDFTDEGEAIPASRSTTIDKRLPHRKGTVAVGHLPVSEQHIHALAPARSPRSASRTIEQARALRVRWPVLQHTEDIQQLHRYYWGHNETLADELWDSLDTDPLEVALTDDYARAHNIDVSVFRFPWDESKGVYYLKLFHNLHCLKSMRKAFIDLERTGRMTPTISRHHVHHCLDGLRQDLICQADDTPMPMTAMPDKVGHNQVRMCRSYDELVAWTRQPERHACYHRWTDYGEPVVNRIESYAFCPEDSPYYRLQNAYFEKWGHADPFGRDR